MTSSQTSSNLLTVQAELAFLVCSDLDDISLRLYLKGLYCLFLKALTTNIFYIAA